MILLRLGYILADRERRRESFLATTHLSNLSGQIALSEGTAISGCALLLRIDVGLLVH